MLLKNGKVLNKDFTFQNLDILIDEGKIVSLYNCGEGHPADDTIDLHGLMVLPGLVDIHTHGCAGFDTMDGSYTALNTVSKFMAKNGVTSFLPTTITENKETIAKAFANVNETVQKGTEGARIIGINMEGPYFSSKYKGAHNENYLKDPSTQELLELQKTSGNLIKIISIAPEKPGAMDFIKNLSQNGIVISLGHTGCDYETAMSAIENGATHITHMFNGMVGLHHREPGLIGAAFDKNLTVELICDGNHVHPAIIRMLYKTVGSDQIVLISDSIRGAGLEDGVYDFGGQTMTVEKGIATLKGGTLAGSTATLLHCVKKAVEFGLPLHDAVKMATINPARVIGVDQTIGSIEQGKHADLIIVNDKLEIFYTILQGKIISKQ